MKTLPAVLFCLIIGTTSALSQQMTMTGGNPLLTVTSGTIAGGIIEVSNSTTVLQYKRVSKKTKITAQASCPNQKFNLSVEAVSTTDGSSAGPVILTNGMAATDMIVNIPLTDKATPFRTATLLFRATSTFAQGNSTELGNDTFTITYTQTAQ